MKVLISSRILLGRHPGFLVCIGAPFFGQIIGFVSWDLQFLKKSGETGSVGLRSGEKNLFVDRLSKSFDENGKTG
jgi:hypothetical protein